jgi:nitrogen-specific signal transduction histidine kinase/ActR/RegA family two-component response regulator
VRDAAGRVCRIAGVAEDITARRSLEEQVRQSQKMEAIGTLAGGIAHDFNNILGVINGYVEMLRPQMVHDAQSSEDLAAVATAAARAGSLVTQILTFSRQEEVRREPMRLAPVIEEAVRFLRATIPSSIAIDCQLAAAAPAVLADATQIHQVVMNLGTNAWHAMRVGRGRLDVRLEACELDCDLGGLASKLRPGRYARLSVRDTGTGMDQATIDRVFEPFFTTKPVGEGTGLGLAVVHGIVEAHEGAITVQSRPGHGTVFSLYFPEHAAAAADLAGDDTPPARGSGERILYVDDETPLVRLGKRLLERLGYVVDAHASVEEALALVRADPALFDVVVTDQTMPGMTGMEFARQIGRLRADLPVILMTGYASRVTNEELRDAGILEVVAKPSALPEIGAAVRRCLARKQGG